MAQLASNPVGLLHLPQELLIKVSSYLDIQSAITLSTTCRDLQLPAESRIWQQVHITQDDILGLTNKSRIAPFDIPQVPDEEDDIEEESEGLFTHLSNIHLEVWALRSQALIYHLNHLLNLYPWRNNSVKELNLELRYEIPKEVIDLLKSLPSLKELIIDFPEVSPISATKDVLADFITCLELFRSLEEHPLTQLRKIKISLNFSWDDTVIYILLSAPNLEFLDINSQLMRGKFDKIDAVDYNLTIPSSLKLKELIIQEMYPSFVRTLENIVEASPNLEKVALKDQALLWRPDDGDSLMEKLAQVEKLKTLEISSNCLGFLYDLERWGHLEELKMIWSCVNLKNMEDGRPVAPQHIIPPLPNLRRYQIEISIYATTFQAFGQLTEPHLSVTALLVARIPAELNNAPNLGIIHCPSFRHSLDNERPGEDNTWDYEHEQFQGMVIYSFINSKGDELIHCRTKIQHPSNNSSTRPRWMGNSAGWEEYGYYNGKSLPTRVLAGVYGITGMTLDNIAPGRGLSMGQKGWDLLRTWVGQDESWS